MKHKEDTESAPQEPLPCVRDPTHDIPSPTLRVKHVGRGQEKGLGWGRAGSERGAVIL